MSTPTSNYCENVITADGVPVGGRSVGLVILITGILYLLTAIVLIFFIERKVVQAKDGNGADEIAQSAVIFPIYVKILWAVVLTNVYVCIITLSLQYATETQDGLPTSSVWALSTMKMVQHMVTEGVAILLMRKGLGYYAAVKTLYQAFSWGLFTLAIKTIVYYTMDTSKLLSRVINCLYNFSILFLYLALWIVPDHRLFRRPAAKDYAKFWVFFRVIASTAEILSYSTITYPAGLCINIFVVFLALGIFFPYYVYVCLLQVYL